MNDETCARILEIAADIFERAVDELDVGSTPDDIDSWDSVAQLNLMMALEDEYGITFDPNDVDQMTSLGAVVELVHVRSG